MDHLKLIVQALKNQKKLRVCHKSKPFVQMFFMIKVAWRWLRKV